MILILLFTKYLYTKSKIFLPSKLDAVNRTPLLLGLLSDRIELIVFMTVMNSSVHEEAVILS